MLDGFEPFGGDGSGFSKFSVGFMVVDDELK